MSDLKKLPLSKSVEIRKAVSIIENNDTLSARTMYQLGRLSDRVKTRVNLFDKIRNQKAAELNAKIKVILDKSPSQTEHERLLAQEAITDLKNENTLEMNDLFNAEEDVNVPILKLSEFIASEDNPAKNIKKGQSLVPQQFFTLMGELIIED